MPPKSAKQERTMLAIEHGWKPKKGKLRKITKKTAKKILGKH
jgi:hypothetical protein